MCVMKTSFKQYFLLRIVAWEPGLLSLEQTCAWFLWEPDSSSGCALVGGADLSPLQSPEGLPSLG